MCPFRGELGPRLIQFYNVDWAEVYFRTTWRLHPSGRLATIDMGQILGGGVPFYLGELGHHQTQSRLGRGLPPYQVALLVRPAVWPQRTLAENWGGCAPLGEGELGRHLTQCRVGRGLPPC